MQKSKVETTVGIFLLVGVLCLAYMAIKLGHISLLGDKSYPLYARFTSVTGLRRGSSVYIMGLKCGQVTQLNLDQENHQVIVELHIQKGIKVYDDAIVSVKTEGVIGEKYLDLDPGGAGEILPAGGTITETQAAVEIIDLIAKYALGQIKEK